MKLKSRGSDGSKSLRQVGQDRSAEPGRSRALPVPEEDEQRAFLPPGHSRPLTVRPYGKGRPAVLEGLPLLRNVLRLLVDADRAVSKGLGLFTTEWSGSKVDQNVPTVFVIDRAGIVQFKYFSQNTLDRPGVEYVADPYAVCEGADALVVLTNGPAHLTDLVNGDSFSGSSSSPAAVAGYPTITLPAGPIVASTSFFASEASPRRKLASPRP